MVFLSKRGGLGGGWMGRGLGGGGAELGAGREERNERG